MKCHLSLIYRKMAVYCGQQTKYAEVNYGEPGTTQYLFYYLITMACLLVVFYFVFYFLPRRASSSSRSMCLFHSTNSCSTFLSIWRSRSSCVSFRPFNSLIVRLIQKTRMNSAVICGHHFVITSALIVFTGAFVSHRAGRNDYH